MSSGCSPRENAKLAQDRAGLSRAHTYFEDEPARRAATRLMTRDEARRIAANIAKLPELVKHIRPRPYRLSPCNVTCSALRMYQASVSSTVHAVGKRRVSIVRLALLV